MIQFKRGKTASWRALKKPLADGQPGYDRTRHKLKVGDGTKSWDELPNVGMSPEEVLDSEANARGRRIVDKYDTTVITYGTAAPDKDTVGQLYLQQYDSEPEADYIVYYGVDGIWSYQIWKSGVARCWGTLSLATKVQNAVGNGSLYSNETKIAKVEYPFAFRSAPAETATLSSAKNKIAWLASKEPNSKSGTGSYIILSYDKHDNAEYKITLDVKGPIDFSAWNKRK